LVVATDSGPIITWIADEDNTEKIEDEDDEVAEDDDDSAD
jgi:hypothetical protein